MQIETRPFTAEERNSLLKARKALREQSSAGDFLKYLVVWAGLMGILLLIRRFYPGLQRYQVACLISAAIVTVLIVWRWRRWEMRVGIRGSDPLEAELQDGLAEVGTFDVTDAVAVKEFEDEGLHYYLAVANDKTLFLSGQYLYEYAGPKQFPSTRFQIVRVAKTRTVLDLKSLGRYLPPSRTLPAFTKSDYENDRIPCDGDILDFELSTLNCERGPDV